jgi:2-polyprenyl-3-methyl-5-hydroxy-6-metoxy-1,4-benzoquinol methylase
VPTEGLVQGQDVTELVKEFYEQTPFPNYDDLDNHRALLEKARSGLFARLLNEQIPYNARVVEIGCGTGQLTNFLAIAHRSVLGVDVCLNSLQLAQRFKQEHGLDRAVFAQMNLFRPGLKDGFFDVVISNGVLHLLPTAAVLSSVSVAWSSPGDMWWLACTTPTAASCTMPGVWCSAVRV